PVLLEEYLLLLHRAKGGTTGSRTRATKYDAGYNSGKEKDRPSGSEPGADDETREVVVQQNRLETILAESAFNQKALRQLNTS
ncbi:unnamed protein product, partial [Amoebophrya sp. A120]